jgi:hypothetical protein
METKKNICYRCDSETDNEPQDDDDFVMCDECRRDDFILTMRELESDEK